MTVEEERTRAHEKLAAVSKGIDPVAQEAKSAGLLTVAEICDWYIAEADVGRMLGRRWQIGSLKLGDIERAQADIVVGKTSKARVGSRGGATTCGEGCREPSWRGLIELLVQIAFLQRHHPSAEQLNTGAAIHGSLEGLQSVDLSFGLPVAPGLRHSVPHRLQVLAYRLRKTLHCVDPRRARIDQPSVQPLFRSTAKQASKPHRQAPHRCELGGRRFQRIDAGDLPGGHLAAGFDAKRRRGQRDHPTGHWIQRSHTDRAGSSCSSPSREGSPPRQGARKRAR